MQMGFGGLFMIIFWVFVIAGIVLLVKLAMSDSKGEEKPETTLNILKKRYANGDIGKEEFVHKKREITVL